MPKRKIAFFGIDIPGNEELTLPLLSKTSIIDYDISVFQFNFSQFYSYTRETYLGKPCLNDDCSFRLKEQIHHWRREILEALRVGKTIFVFLNDLQEFYVSTGEKTFSGTGRNQKTTLVVESINNLACIPGGLSYREAKGKSMRLKGPNSAISSYWATFSENSEFRMIIDGKISNPLVFPKSGNSPVGASIKYKDSNGILFLMPFLDFNQDSFSYEKEDEYYWTDEAIDYGNRFVSNIFNIDEQIKKSDISTPIPEWLIDDRRYRLEEENKISEKLLKTGRKIQKLELEKEALETQLKKEVNIKGLVFEKGNLLESAIIDALKILGFKADNYKDHHSEFDVVFESPEGRFLGEAEGKDNKAINIDKLRQLEMNIHEDFSRDEIDKPAKGVLIGNAFRLTPPDKRGDFFTEKCTLSAKRSNTALIRSIDLFDVAKYLSNSKDDDFSKSCRQAMLTGVGLINFPKIPDLDTSDIEEEPAVKE